MRTLIATLATIALMVCGNILHAQSAPSVTLLESDKTMAIFSVEAKAAKAADVTDEAFRLLFNTLLDEGVEGFNGGRKLMDNPNPKWRENFMRQKNPQFLNYIKGYTPEGAPVANKVGEFEGTVVVRVNAEFLFRQLKQYKVMN